MKYVLIIFIVFCHAMLHSQIVNYQVNDGTATNPEEVTITINPTAPTHWAAGSNLHYFYHSEDGGKTWTTSVLRSQYGVWGDPVVMYDETGNLYYGHLSNPPSNGYWIDRIVVQTSPDNGTTWNNDVGIGFHTPKNQDKEWLAADFTNSAYNGTIYMCWTEFDTYGSSDPADSSRILFSRTADRGVSWSEPIQINDRNGDCLDDDNTVEGAVPAVGPNGEIYVAWSSPYGILFDKSTDGGTTWGSDIPIAPQIGGWAFDVSGISRANGLPFTLCDVSQSPYRGTVYVVWSDQRNGTDNTDIFLVKSSDGGNTWSAIKKINDDTSGRHQFFPNAVVDPVTGVLYVVFYDRRATTDFGTDVYLARSDDGGETFTNLKISQSTFYPNSGVFFGDYIDIDAYDGLIAPIWMRLDGEELSVWTAPMTDALLALPTEQIKKRQFALKQNYPNPFNSQTRIEYFLPEPSPIRLSVYNTMGQEVAVLSVGARERGYHTLKFDAGNLPSGVYIYKLVAGTYQFSKKMLLVK